MPSEQQFLTIKDARDWVSRFLQLDVSESNISYLIQYGKIPKHNGDKRVLINVADLKNYYARHRNARATSWKKQLGDDLNWDLSFEHLREKDTTKHVHRLHPYKGKFIPQLVEYFIDNHADNFKRGVYFNSGDIILDPFAGSGTTLIQAQEMGIDAIGVDISNFNCMMMRTKLCRYDIPALRNAIAQINSALEYYETDNQIQTFENELLKAMAYFNKTHFPSPEFKIKIAHGDIDEKTYAHEKEIEFLDVYNNLVKKYAIDIIPRNQDSFLDKWYIRNVRREIDFTFEQIRSIENKDNKQILALILSRTIRSCRATTHSDLATLKAPQCTSYYCWKHKKICKPIFSIKSWFERYAYDTLKRVGEYACLKTQASHTVLQGDGRTIDIFSEIKQRNPQFHKKLCAQKIKGIFTSPPYVGQIDYHEQHAYAYDLFGFERNDALEIGPLYKGQGVAARKSYAEGVAAVLQNCRRFLADDFNVFLVANDKYNLYPQIAENAGMHIYQQFKRPVINRTERDKSPYAEIIFHLKNGI